MSATPFSNGIYLYKNILHVCMCVCVHVYFTLVIAFVLCNAVVRCDDLVVTPPLLNLTDTVGITFDQAVHFQCDTGFFLQGHMYITCTEFGNYTAPLPTCESKEFLALYLLYMYMCIYAQKQH